MSSGRPDRGSTLAVRRIATLIVGSGLALLLPACEKEIHRPEVVESNTPWGRAAEPHEVAIALPPAAPRIHIDGPDGPAAVPCGTCHLTRESDATVNSAAELDEFHPGLVYAHGDQSCVSCHEPGGYDRLRLADGVSIDFSESMRLCRQCHGTQARDYDAGAHGGWNGHWDLRSGPRDRNHCIHCHDPHSPAFPPMLPTFRPLDRFLDESHLEGHDSGARGATPASGEEHP